MALQLSRVHTIRVLPDGRKITEKINPYMRLCADTGPPVYVQKGILYGAGGREVKEKDIPAWFGSELAKVDREYAKSCGMTDAAIDKYIRKSQKEEPKPEEPKVEVVKSRRGRPRKTA